MTNSTNPLATSTLTFRPLLSLIPSAMLAGIVVGFEELNNRKLTTPVADNTMATAIVSPSARPRPSIEIGRHTSELQSRFDLVCRLLLEKKKNNQMTSINT